MKQLGITDSAFINLEHPNNPQHVGSFGIYDQSTAPGGKVRFKQLIAHFEHQVKKLPLFRTRLINSPGGFARPYWHVDEDFDVEFHVRHIAVPKPGDWRQLCILMARLHSRPIDMSRPLWEVYVIEGLDNVEGLPKGCFVIFSKLHHSLVDGGGGAEFMQAIHDLEPIVHDHTGEEPETYEGDAKLSKMNYYKELTRNYFNSAWSEGKGALDVIGETAKSVVKLAKGELPKPPMDAPETRFNQPVGPYRVIEATTFKLADIKYIKNKTKTTVNDVALAITSGAMRKYLEHHKEMPKQSLVATVPMNMRSRRGDNQENNQVGSMFASLNSNIDNPVERIIAIHHSAMDAKRLGENTPLADTLKLAGALSPRFTKRLVNLYVDNKLTTFLPLKVNTVVSNIPGPPIELYASGARMVKYHGLGVLTPGVGLFHLVFSYLDEVSMTILADRDMMPDPQFYRECIEAAFDELKQAVDDTTEMQVDRFIAKQTGTVLPELSKTASASKAASKKPKAKATRKKAASSSSSSAKAPAAKPKKKAAATTKAASAKPAKKAAKKASSAKATSVAKDANA